MVKRKTVKRPRARSAKRPAPKGLFSHHRHTGRVLHHSHTSYPLVILLLLMVGVFLAHATFQVRAATVVVTAAANGPLPPSPAVILDPEEGDRISAIPIPVSGTCPYPYFVRLYRNNTFSGSTQCNPDGTWLLYSDLFVGENELVARIFNAADQEGPQSAPVTVYYEPPGPSPPGPGPVSPTDPGGDGSPGAATPGEEVSNPFLITTDVFFKAIFVGQEISWEFGVVGGDEPFDVTVAWGDGGTSTITDLRERKFTVSHLYTKAPTSREYFPVTVSARDADDRKASLQVFTILNDRITPIGGGSSTGGDGPGGTDITWLRRIWLAWPAYAITLLMVISFWLGQRRGLIILARGPKSIQKFHRKHFYRPPKRHA
ncbi:MAG TPA: hypothetical protein VK674_01970 [Candidatus Limnocylindria bacterium]|nr:hypothetical protein [Candidatus Limnocylindria bacterium]